MFENWKWDDPPDDEALPKGYSNCVAAIVNIWRATGNHLKVVRAVAALIGLGKLPAQSRSGFDHAPTRVLKGRRRRQQRTRNVYL